MWDQLIELINKNLGAIVVALVSAIAGALLTKFAPWLWAQLLRLGRAFFALVSGRGRDYEFERKYLNALILRHGFLGLLPSKPAAERQQRGQLKQAVELEKVFVDLVVTGGYSSHAEIDAGGFLQLMPASTRREREQPPSDIGRAIEHNARLVIRGDPGSGKTTLMKYLAVTCARARRNDARAGDRRDFVWQRLGWQTRPFPIFVSLGRHGAVTTWGKERTLLDAFTEEFSEEATDCPNDFFKRRLQRGNCLILLDAFDEIGGQDGREAMARQIVGILGDYKDKRNRVVVTTRIVGYEGQFDTRGFVVQTVQPLADRQITALVRQRYAAIAFNEGENEPADRAQAITRDYARRADNLLAQLEHNARMRELATNPLLLALIVLVHSANVELPEERHILYRDCVEILTQRWRQHKRDQLLLPSERKDDLNLPQKIVLLQQIALTMQRQRTNPAEGQVPLLRRDAEAIIAAQLPQFLTGLPADAHDRAALCAQKATAWVDGIKQESGILVEIGLDKMTGDPLVSFSHLTFQEYLAALALREETGLSATLLDHALNQVWQEVLLLYAAMSPKAMATQIVRRLLAAATPADPSGLLTAAGVVADKVVLEEPERQGVLNGLENLVKTSEQAKRLRGCELLAKLGTPESAAILLAVMENDNALRVNVGQILGRLGDPRPDVACAIPAMENVPAGEFIMGEGNAQHRITLKAYRIGKYPVTNAQYKRFIADGGYGAKWKTCWTEAGWQWREKDKVEKPEYWDDVKWNLDNHPVVGVSWHEAAAYCNWLTRTEQKWQFRLPTEAEWEKAARSTDGREYPWGNGFDKEKCNTREGGIGRTSAVGLFPRGVSVCGALDMAGNVWEWCNTRYRAYPYWADDGRENPPAEEKSSRGFLSRLLTRDSGDSTDSRVLRGGSWYLDDVGACCTFRNGYFPVYRFYSIGFRVAESFSTST